MRPLILFVPKSHYYHIWHDHFLCSPNPFLFIHVHVHARSGCWRWLGWFFSFPPWCSTFFATLLLLKPAPARETIAQQVIFIWSSINKIMDYCLTQFKFAQWKLTIASCFSYISPFADLIISGGGSGYRTKKSIETFPAKANCTIPPFPDEGNLSSLGKHHWECCSLQTGIAKMGRGVKMLARMRMVWGTYLEKNCPCSKGHLLDFGGSEPLPGWFGALM